jgi:hypothetical protein
VAVAHRIPYVETARFLLRIRFRALAGLRAPGRAIVCEGKVRTRQLTLDEPEMDNEVTPRGTKVENAEPRERVVAVLGDAN